MKTEFQAKYLQHLLKKKKENEGFTLIELMVVVVIIGILAAIALPNLIGQIAKSRETDARNTLGALNRSQQANYIETAQFADSISNLNVSASTQYYDYSVVGTPGTATFVAMQANAKPDNSVKSYGSGVTTADNNFSFILCSTQGVAETGPEVTNTTDTGCGDGVKIKQ